MKVAGMIRLSEIDEVKVGKYYMKLSILSLSEMVSHLYFLKNRRDFSRNDGFCE